jgi:cell division protein FtsI (penicillin-binding protein 3)
VTGRPPVGGRPRYRPVHRAPRRGLGRRGQVRAFKMLIFSAIAFTVICVRLVAIQGFDSARYLAAGGSEWEQTVTLPGERGAILDRNGYELAMSIPQTTIYADPRQVAEPAVEAGQLSPVLGISAATLQSEMTGPGTFEYLARTIPDDQAKQVAALHLAGVYSLSEPKRFYPAGQLASPLLGAVGTEGVGLSGLETGYNTLLTGQDGHEVEQIDPQGQLVPGGVQEYQAPVAGQDLVLTLDEPLQYQAEQALAQALVAAKAKRGIALLMDTTTGAILADAELTMPGPGNQLPQAVPVTVGTPGATGAPSQPVEESSATSFTDVYEPGSVNKLITISAALQQGVIKPSDVFGIPNSYRVANTTFHDAESHPTEHWSVTDILANSSNIGTIQIAQKLGHTNLMQYIGSYGLGSVSAVGFPGESGGLLPTYWSGTSIADVPIGQGIAVTAIQMLAAYNTIASGGVYVPPRLVDATVDGQGREHVLPQVASHRVVSQTVADEMRTMLEEVVRVGTGTAANLDPYTVAGKTGTALAPSPKGGYLSGHYVASFGGFVPAEKPQITGMVVVDDTADYGAAASAPTFAKIARAALEEFSIPPMPKLPPAPGVPLSTNASATGAGEIAGTPLPGITNPVTKVSTTTSPSSTSPSTTASTSPTSSTSTGPTTQPVSSSTASTSSTTSPSGHPPPTAPPSTSPGVTTTTRARSNPGSG